MLIRRNSSSHAYCFWLIIIVLVSSVIPCEYHHNDHDDDYNYLSSDYNNNDRHGNLRKTYINSNIRQLNTLRDDIHEIKHYSNEEEIVECGFTDPTDEELAIDQINMRLWAKERSSNIMYRNNNDDNYTGSRLYVIPTYFHIIQPSFFIGLVGSERIQQYITYLNDAFSNSNAPFIFQYMNTSITYNEQWGDYCGISDIEIAIKSTLKIGGAESLNIYICNKVPNRQGVGSLNGFSFLPSSTSNTFIRDGVMLSRSERDERLNTLVHEVGHFMGLLHTFGQNTCDPYSYGDGVADTPLHISKASEVNCHSNPDDWDTCPDSPGIDPVDNYMTYSADNFCRTRFTPGQVYRMVAQYEIYRLPYATTTTNSNTDPPQVAIVPAPTTISPTTIMPTPAPTVEPTTTKPRPNINQIIQNGIKNGGKKNTTESCKKFIDVCTSDDECCTKKCFTSSTTVVRRCWF